MTSFDHFGIANLFYGPQIGLSASLHYGPCSLDMMGKVALGVMHQSARIQGNTIVRMNDGTLNSSESGVFAPPGSGAFSSDQFAVIPELSVTAGYRVTSWLRVQVGYDFLLVSRLTRAASLVGDVDSRQVFQLSSFDPTVHSSVPSGGLAGSSFWVQGLTCGLELQF